MHTQNYIYTYYTYKYYNFESVKFQYRYMQEVNQIEAQCACSFYCNTSVLHPPSSTCFTIAAAHGPLPNCHSN